MIIKRIVHMACLSLLNANSVLFEHSVYIYVYFRVEITGLPDRRSSVPPPYLSFTTYVPNRLVVILFPSQHLYCNPLICLRYNGERLQITT